MLGWCFYGSSYRPSYDLIMTIKYLELRAFMEKLTRRIGVLGTPKIHNEKEPPGLDLP
jgi:hypothetical protein